MVLRYVSGAFSDFVTKILGVTTPLFLRQCDKVTVYDHKVSEKAEEFSCRSAFINLKKEIK
jgi:hypothetical protein